MKLNSKIIVLFVAGAFCGCSKNETTSQPAVESSAPAAAQPAKALETVQASEPAKVVVETPPAPKAIEATAPAPDTSVQELIAKARTLAAEKKYAEASVVVQELGGKVLNADQAATVESLKQQIQTALTSKATESAAGALGKAFPK